MDIKFLNSVNLKETLVSRHWQSHFDCLIHIYNAIKSIMSLFGIPYFHYSLFTTIDNRL